MAEPETHLLADDGVFPNSVLPLLLYRQAVPEGGAETIEALFERNGWPPAWRSAVADYHHYHSTTHECLGVARGTATIRFGGPEGQSVSVAPGDVVVIPAGVAHRQEQASADFMMVGGYPEGAPDWDMLPGKPGERPAADRRIAAIPLPPGDPVSGADGALPQLWAKAGSAQSGT